MAHDYLTDAGIESFVFDAASSHLLGNNSHLAFTTFENPHF